MIMPKMRGPELAKRIAVLRPQIKVIFISGYTEYSDNSQSESEESAVLLMKPFERSELLRVVREVLDGLGVNSR
jgi:two-component system cell cycle sensor histidine kinase/response regulator CckA